MHPQFRYHNVLVNALLESDERNALYVTLPHPFTTLDAFWPLLARAFKELYSIDLPADGGSSINGAVAGLTTALESIQPAVVVLSDFDQASEDVVAFVARTASELGTRVLFVIKSRAWPEMLLNQTSIHNVSVLPVSTNDMLIDYLSHDPSRMLLEVKALGSGQVLVNGRQIEQWDGALPRALFFYFIDRGMTTRDEVFNTFWPELSTREATNVFHVTKRKISEILNVDLTVYSSGFYRIAPMIDLHYDVVAFAEAVQNSAVAEPDEAEQLLERAIRLHERDFLRDFDQPWALRRRDELRGTYVDALTALARLYEDAGRTTEALGLYNRAFGAFPQREDLVRAQMRLYQDAGQPDRSLVIYERLVTELQRSLGVAPSPETEALALEIRQLEGKDN
ncbi:MAG: bacterial transcriptional activator domain-containing protein [Anaerolineae bacterium]|nr:bacterial transcriptional activator domain-containing protein [Anaerolineae bacterium]